MEKKKNRIWPWAALIALAILLCGAAYFGWTKYSELQQEKQELNTQLGQSEMELSLSRLAAQQRSARAEQKEQDYQNMLAEREDLKLSMMEQDKAELLQLVNPWNEISAEYEPRLVDIGDDKLLDERAAGAFEHMIKDCIAAGWAPVPISTYRTQEYQQELFDNKMMRVRAAGTPEEEVEATAAQEVAKPGTSEHQLGLACDVIDEYYTELDYVQMWTSTQQWLMAHCTDYGFILRYPDGTSEITGIIYEPWHYRYVGVSVAKEISELGVTFEEYLQLKNPA